MRISKFEALNRAIKLFYAMSVGNYKEILQHRYMTPLYAARPYTSLLSNSGCVGNKFR
jgi:hypothetical protein